MTNSKLNLDEIHSLCEAVLEGRLSVAEKNRLEELVLTYPDAKQIYVECLHQHACLSATDVGGPLSQYDLDESESGSLGNETSLARRKVSSATAKRALKTWQRRTWIAGFVAASLMVAGLWSLFLGPSIKAADKWATLINSSNCKWGPSSLPTQDGSRIGAGRLRLLEGIAEIELDNKTRITLESPADLELVSQDKCILEEGRLVALVSPAGLGFQVETKSALLTDQGTEFGVNVSDSGTVDLRVFDGRVDAFHRNTGKERKVVTGQQIRFTNRASREFDPELELAPGAELLEDSEKRYLLISTALGKGKDAYVRSKLVPPDMRSSTLLLVKNTGAVKGTANRKAYFTIDLSPSNGARVVDAQLRMTSVATGVGFGSLEEDATFSVYGIVDESLDSWDDRETIWGNAPANKNGGTALDKDKVVFLGGFQIARGVLNTTVDISGSSLVNFLNTDTNSLATFVVVRETVESVENGLVHGFASKRHPTLSPPTLRLAVKDMR